MSIVPMKREGCWLKFAIILALKISCFALSSKYNLFEETKAISTPEKKAEKTIEAMMPMIWALSKLILLGSIFFFFDPFVLGELVIE